MSDILALLGQLEEEEAKKKNAGKSKKDLAAQNAGKNARRRLVSELPTYHPY